tara:strand:- start:94 stop:612 length:519 start_codon:yes stop_codon:yes gene_type:complete
MIICKKIEAYYFLTSIKEHSKTKKVLLSLINQIPKTQYEDVSHTDWNLPKDYVRPYLAPFVDIIKPYMFKLTKKMKHKTWGIHNFWFQQYEKKGYHNWHTHGSTQFSNVYFLELPDKKYGTEFLNVVTNKKFKINVKEGDLLTFPSCMFHRSPKINSKKRKTIIAFNSSFDF